MRCAQSPCLCVTGAQLCTHHKASPFCVIQACRTGSQWSTPTTNLTSSGRSAPILAQPWTCLYPSTCSCPLCSPTSTSNTCLQVGFVSLLTSPSNTATPASRWVLSFCWQPFQHSNTCLQVAFVCLLTALPTQQHLPPGGFCLSVDSPSYTATPASRWVLSLCWPALPTQQHLPPGGFCLSVDSPSNPATPASRWVLSLCWPALPTQQHLPPGGLLSVCWQPFLHSNTCLQVGFCLSVCWQPFLHSNTCLQVGFCLSVDSPSYTATPASRWAFVCLLTALPTQQHLPPGCLFLCLSVDWPFPHSNTCPQVGFCLSVDSPSYTATPASRVFVSLSLCWPTLPTQQHLPPGGLLSPLSVNQPFLNSDICLQVGVCLSVDQPFQHSNTCPQVGFCLLYLSTSPSYTATPAPRWAFVSFIYQPALPTQQHLPPGGLLSVSSFATHCPRLSPPSPPPLPPPIPIHYWGRKTLCWLLITVHPLFHRFRPAEGHARQQLEPEPPPEAATLQQAAAACPVQLWSLPAQPGKGAASRCWKSLLPGAFSALVGHLDLKQKQNNKRWITWQLSFVSFLIAKDTQCMMLYKQRIGQGICMDSYPYEEVLMVKLF